LEVDLAGIQRAHRQRLGQRRRVSCTQPTKHLRWFWDRPIPEFCSATNHLSISQICDETRSINFCPDPEPGIHIASRMVTECLLEHIVADASNCHI